jgi:hypothetical protein
MRYRVTGSDSSGSNLFSRVVEAIGSDHANIVAWLSCAGPLPMHTWRPRPGGARLRPIDDPTP